MDLYESDIFVS